MKKNTYTIPLALVFSLFFLWAISSNLLPTMIRQLMKTCELNTFEASFTETAYWLAYFIFPIPIAMFMKRYSYKAGIIFGLLLAAVGGLLFFPAAMLKEYWAYLCIFFIIATGMCFLETAANPYVTVLGAPETAPRRLNLAQSFNGLGCICGPLVGGLLLFSEEGSSHISFPYMLMGIVVLGVALVFSRIKLPEIVHADEVTETGGKQGLWSHKLFVFGVFALFCYEVAEISINSFFINYVVDDGWMNARDASVLLSFGGLGLFMCGRFVGSWVMRFIRAERVLLCCAVGTVFATLLVICNLGHISLVALFFVYAFEAIMFPTIFAISLKGLGNHTKRASSYLMMSPIGGAIGPVLMGYVADNSNMSLSFIVPFVAFCVVLFYSLRAEHESIEQ